MAYASTRREGAVEIIGHRGSPREHRENTLPSFTRAFALGSDGIELDVHGTSDGVVVIHHDPVTNARTGDTGPQALIAETTLASLHAIAGSPEQIPTLEALLAGVPEHAIVYVEVKARNIEEHVVAVIRESRTRCAVHSFDHRVAHRVHVIAPDIPVGILQTSYPIDPIRPMRDAGARDLWQHWELIDQSLIATVHEDGRRIIAWTVNDADVARRLISWQVDGLCTDIPGVMRPLRDELVG